jgi:glutamate/tyrosine decarboxylase-like PLP-dependent enzyme
VRDAEKHRATFALHPEYLDEKPRGLASGEFLSDCVFELSRGFKALKIWMSLKEHGVRKFGRLIDQNIAQGAYLSDRIKATPELELLVPTNINIVCFRHRGDGGAEEAIKDLNTEIMLRIQESGTRDDLRHDRPQSALPSGCDQPSNSAGGSGPADQRGHATRTGYRQKKVG